MDIKFTDSAVKSIKKLDKNIQLRIKKKLEWFISQENSLLFAEPLNDFRIGGYRFRIGDFRVIFDIEDDTIIVHIIGHRREIYK